MKKIMNLLKGKARLTSVFAILLLAFAITIPASAQILTRQLEIGMSGSDVTTLQTFLAQDRAIYPEGLITGYFGPLTKAAVARFQARNAISTVGRVGPITLNAINGFLAGGGVGAGNDVSGPAISNVSVMNSWNGGYWNSPTGTWYNNSSGTSTWQSMYGTRYDTQTGATVNTNYGQYATAIHWNTNEPATGLVYYSTSPMPMTETMADAQIVGQTALMDTSLKTTHDVVLPNLQPNMTYYYIIYTRDSVGNVSITWPTTFRTQ